MKNVYCFTTVELKKRMSSYVESYCVYDSFIIKKVSINNHLYDRVYKEDYRGFKLSIIPVGFIRLRINIL